MSYIIYSAYAGLSYIKVQLIIDQLGYFFNNEVTKHSTVMENCPRHNNIHGYNIHHYSFE